MVRVQKDECGAAAEKFRRSTCEENMQSTCVRCFRSSTGFEEAMVHDLGFISFFSKINKICIDFLVPDYSTLAIFLVCVSWSGQRHDASDVCSCFIRLDGLNTRLGSVLHLTGRSG